MKLRLKVIMILFWFRSLSCLNCSEQMQTPKPNLSGNHFCTETEKRRFLNFSNKFDSSCQVTTVAIRVYLF